MARSLARSQVYQSAADAPATLRAYKADLANFKAWCLERKLDPMPATPEIVGAYLADAGRGYALSTLRRRVAAIARAHRIAKQPLDTRHPAIRETLRGIARTHGEPPRRSAALTTAEIWRLVVVCGTDIAGIRDRALFLVGFAGALRRSELVGLDVEHVTWTKEGLRLLIVRSKTDKEGAGAEIGIPRGQAAETCPVAALRLWLEEAEIKSGPIFRKVDRWGASTPDGWIPTPCARSSRSAPPRRRSAARSGSRSRRTACGRGSSPRPTRTASRTRRSWATRAIAASPPCAAMCVAPNSEPPARPASWVFDGSIQPTCRFRRAISPPLHRSTPARKSASDVGELTAAIRRRSGLLGGFGRVRVCRIGLRPFAFRDARSAPGLRASSGFRRRGRFGSGCPLLFPACLDLVPDHRQSGFGYRRSRLLRHRVKSVQKGLCDRLGPARQTG